MPHKAKVFFDLLTKLAKKCIFLANYLVVSKKSSTFAGDLRKRV